jgi:hypothetical protein
MAPSIDRGRSGGGVTGVTGTRRVRLESVRIDGLEPDADNKAGRAA